MKIIPSFDMPKPPKISQWIALDKPRSLAVLDAVKGDGIGGAPEGSVYISRIIVPRDHRGKGYGRLMLKAACDMADVLDMTLCLVAAPYMDSPLKERELTAWYERNGFVDDNCGFLIRQPQRATFDEMCET